MLVLAFTALVALAAVYDVLTIAWHRARETAHVSHAVIIGCTMEALAAIPFILAIELAEWWPIAAGVVGSAIGTTWGMRRAQANRG
jgi:ABC-type methionine transport system permease subunit